MFGQAPRTRATLRTTAVAATIAWLLGGAFALPARAAGFTVNSIADAIDAAPGNGVCATSGGACTLRAAIMEANVLPGADVITLPAGTYTLTLGPADNDGLSTASRATQGDLDIEDDVTINGSGAGSTIIDANNLDRIFDAGYLNDGSAEDATAGNTGDDLTVTNMTLRNGRAGEDDDPPAYSQGNSEAFGGAIRFHGFHGANPSSPASLTVTNVLFAGNDAEHTGGAIFHRFGALTVSGSTFTGNTASKGDGGAILYRNSQPGGLSISNSTFSGNRSLRGTAFDGDFDHLPAGGNGGAVTIENGTSATVTNTSFTNNEAQLDGGAVHTINPVFSMSGSTVTGNKAGRNGGGLYTDPDVSISAAASATLTNLTVQSNTADAAITGAAGTVDNVGNGGGIYHFGGKLTLTGSTLGGAGVGNTARNGGGLAFDTDVPDATNATSDISKNQILANTAAVSGGGIYSAGDGTLSAHLNRIRNNTAPTGKGLRHASGTLQGTRNWWGCNSDPAAGAAACDTVSGVTTGSATINPRLVLTHTASPGIIYVTPPPAGQPNATTLTASVLKDSAGAAVPLADVTVLIGLPLTFGNPVLGTLSAAGTSVTGSGTATATYTSGGTGGPGTADTTVDAAVATATIEVYEPPKITVPANITVTEDTVHGHTASVSWTTTATGYPVPTITCKIGTTTITSPHTFPEGPTTVDCTAASAAGSDTKSFTVTVNTSPTLTVPADITVLEDTPFGDTASVTFTASAQAYPTPVGITCKVGTTTIGSGNDSINVTHTFGEGVTTVSCTASNGINPDETKTFTVTVNTHPTITVPADIAVTEDTVHGHTASVSWTTTATGHPTPTITCKIGATTITSPHTFPEGTTTVDCTATNSVASASDSFDVTVRTSPTVVVPADITVTEDTPHGDTASVTFTATAQGNPTPTITCSVGSTAIGSGSGSATITHTFGEGVTTVSCTGANGVNPDETLTFTVIVNTLPEVTVPADITVTEDPADSGQASVSWTATSTGHPAATITCTIPGPTTITSPHTFPLGTTTVTCTATNSVGSDSDSFDVTVVPANEPPTIVHTGPYLVNEGSTVTLDAGGTTDPESDTFDIAWDLDNNGSYETSGTTAVFDASSLDGTSSHVVGIKATDSKGAASTATTAVIVANVAPTGTLGNDGPVAEGSTATVTFTGQTDPGVADTTAGFSYSYDFDNDGTFEVTDSAAASATVPSGFLDDGPGTRTVRGRIADKDGGFTDYTTDVSVTNVAPTGTLNNTGPAPEGSSPMVFFTSFTDPSTADAAALTYSFDFDNDGTFEVTDSTSPSASVPASLLADGPGTRTVRGRIADDDGGFTDYTTDITITNVAPTATLGNDGPVAEGSSATVTFTGAADPGTADTTAGFSYSYDVDNDGDFEVTDSALASATVPGSVLDDGPGTYTVRARIADKDGGFTDYTTAITVGNVAPTATFGNDGPVAEGSTGTVNFTSPTDPSTADTTAGLLYSYDFDNDGTFEVADSALTSATVPASYLAEGPATRTVRGRVADKDGGFTDYTTDITVSNVAPTATLANDGPVSEGSTATVSLSDQSDPSATDTTAGFGYSFDFDNDGTFEVTGSSTPSATVPATELDDGPGTYTVRARIEDADGGFTDYTTAVTVTNVAPTATLGNAGPVGEGGSTTVTFTGAEDPSTADTTAGFRYSYDFDNDGTFEVTDSSDATGTVTAAFLPDGPGTVTVRGRIADKDGGFTDYTTDVTVTNVAPAVAVSGSHDARIATPYPVALLSTDPGTADMAGTFTYQVNWGDGSTETLTGPNTLAATHTYANTGDYVVTVTTTDKDGATSAPVTWEVTVNGAQLVNDSCTGGQSLVVSGGFGNDLIRLVPAGGQVRVYINHQQRGTFTVTGRLIVFGRDGNDTIQVDSTLALPKLVYGGDGNDRVSGGNGRSMVLGGAGDDTVDTGNARDILIGGTGADTLRGGNGDDILVAGSTSYDGDNAADRASLCRIEREWGSTSTAYANRVRHIHGTLAGGLNGTNYLRGPGAGQTVFDDSSVDLLTGAHGNDWFLYNRYPPGVHDSADLGATEFGTDL